MIYLVLYAAFCTGLIAVLLIRLVWISKRPHRLFDVVNDICDHSQQHDLSDVSFRHYCIYRTVHALRKEGVKKWIVKE